MVRYAVIVLTVALTACSFSVAPEPGADVNAGAATARAPVDCAESGPTVQIKASAEATACLSTKCIDIAQCGEVTKERPTCAVETNGGELIATYACAPCACPTGWQ